MTDLNVNLIISFNCPLSNKITLEC